MSPGHLKVTRKPVSPAGNTDLLPVSRILPFANLSDLTDHQWSADRRLETAAPKGQLPPVLGLAQPKKWRPNRLPGSPSPSRLKARPVDLQRPPDPTSRVRQSRKPEPMEATAHLQRKPCPSRSSSPAWEASGRPWSSLEMPGGPLAQGSCSPEPAGRPDQTWAATALRPKRPCPSRASSLPRERAASLSCRSARSRQEARPWGSLAPPQRSPKSSDLPTQAAEETAALPLRRRCHLRLMEQPWGTTAHPLGSPELPYKSTTVAAATSRQSRSRVRSSSLPPRTSPPSGTQEPASAHPERLSELLHTSWATAPRWRSPDPSSRLVAPPLGSTTLPSTWTAPQSRLTARPSRSPEPQLRESEQRERDPQLKAKQPRWKEAQPLQPQPQPQRETNSLLPETEPEPETETETETETRRRRRPSSSRPRRRIGQQQR
ncbi:PREDICTED: protein ALEX-like [Myotis davidii]|uniref:protein ALEX-like n=1 Tax=Myotis davidii TaxID=225400 RepID=UPI000767B683|nr:PREDICTED: protein ALEX-like [Myotis davidii]